MPTVGLLILSNIFMTLAWYGHLKFFKGDGHSMWMIIFLSWGIAFFEYCFQVPANRLGYGLFTATQLKLIQEAISISVFILFTATQLKLIQEAISISVFILFAIFVLGESLRWNYVVAFGLIGVAVYFAVAVK